MALTSIPKAVGGGVAGPLVGAAIGGVASLVGGKKASSSAKDAAKIQADLSREALAEQRRIYELESGREESRYQQDRADKLADKEFERTKTAADEARVLRSRQGAFGGFGGDLSRFSQGYAPAYGLSADATNAILEARNSRFPAGDGGVPPDLGPQPMNQGPAPSMMNGATMGGSMGAPMSGGSSFASSVWLQAPTGEELEVSMDQAPMFISRGAKIIPGPTRRPL